VRVWDPDVLLGQLAGSNRQYIEEVIPHIGSLLSADLEEVVRSGEVVVIATKVDKDQLARCLGRDQIVIDLVNLASGARPETGGSYQGICW
jgi:GDP-mannose 6-dehydrogenase